MDRKYVKTDEDGVRMFLCRSEDRKFMWYEYEEPVQVLIDHNKAAQAAFNSTGRTGDIRVVAEMPETLYWQWHQEGIIEDKEAFKRRLNDADWKNLRTNNKRV